MLRGSSENVEVTPDLQFWERDVFERGNFPCMYFIEKRLANDPTNWWVPNLGCFQAMLRSAGFKILDHPENEVFVCRRTNVPDPFDYADELREITR